MIEIIFVTQRTLTLEAGRQFNGKPITSANSVSGGVKAGDVEPYIATNGVPTAAATCISPESLVTTRSTKPIKSIASSILVIPTSLYSPHRYQLLSGRTRICLLAHTARYHNHLPQSALAFKMPCRPLLRITKFCTGTKSNEALRRQLQCFITFFWFSTSIIKRGRTLSIELPSTNAKKRSVISGNWVLSSNLISLRRKYRHSPENQFYEGFSEKRY